MPVRARDVRFGPYRLIERIGAGGMAEVHRAILDGPGGFQRTVVIKRMLPHLCHDEAFVRMLLVEGRLTALLHHPNIVQVYEVGDVDGVYYLAMEHVEGVNLWSLLRARARAELPAAVGCAIACELAGALAYAHARSDEAGRPCAIVHRDVSPANVMVTPAGTVKLLDFGIAKAADSLRDLETRTGMLKGKVAYMSPEQAEGETVDRRSDVFALGVVLHEMLTMRRLFRGDDDLQTLKLVRAAVVAPPSAVVPGLDADLDAVVVKMLARRAVDRFASCDEVLAALTPIARRLHGDAAAVRAYLRRVGPIERIVRARPAASVPETATLDAGPRAKAAQATREATREPATTARRRRWVLGAIAAIAAVALIIALGHSRRPSAPAAPAPSVPPTVPAPTSPPAAPASPAAPTPPVALRPSSVPPPRRAHASRPPRLDKAHAAPPRRDQDLYDPFAHP
ncbi:MAG: Serine/threonine-protein kinase Pkn6 [Myxococcales bacterium]|nr:Serine/threonine-protein kinase Pkn6 [Myxococcales bacterium]